MCCFTQKPKVDTPKEKKEEKVSVVVEQKSIQGNPYEIPESIINDLKENAKKQK